MLDYELEKIHCLSVLVGEEFARSYKDRGSASDITHTLLEAYIALRRAIPKTSKLPRYGALLAYKSTQAV